GRGFGRAPGHRLVIGAGIELVRHRQSIPPLLRRTNLRVVGRRTRATKPRVEHRRRRGQPARPPSVVWLWGACVGALCQPKRRSRCLLPDLDEVSLARALPCTRRKEEPMKRLWLGVGAITGLSFAVLLWVGARTAEDAAPIPDLVRTSDGRTVATR